MLVLRIALVALAVALAAAPAAAQTTPGTTFETHATFFSTETRRPDPVDPQVFVRDAHEPGEAGPQGIVHVDGYRPARLADPPEFEVYTAQGKDLGFTLGRWLGATGRVEISGAETARPHVAATFAGLVPNGVYSLFENHFSASGVTFTPLDGAGTANTFTATAAGSGTIVLDATGPFTHANAILLVYHSDGAAHGSERGAIGVAAHHQLIMRFP